MQNDYLDLSQESDTQIKFSIKILNYHEKKIIQLQDLQIFKKPTTSHEKLKIHINIYLRKKECKLGFNYLFIGFIRY